MKKTPKKSSLRFAALDFETADYGRDSACALSIIIVDGNKIVDKVTHLIRPPRQEIVFSYLHGITWAQVRNRPIFKDLWPELSPLLDGLDFLAAHNASFDKRVLHTCCEAAGHKPPKHDFVCTVKLARQAWKIFPTKLPDVCRKLKIPLKHHDAASDALACAKIVLAAIEEGIDPTIALDKKKKKGRILVPINPRPRSVRP